MSSVGNVSGASPFGHGGLDYLNGSSEFLRPIVSGWERLITSAVRHKKPFTDTADQCMQFFAGSTGFMWEDEFRKKFIKGNISPKFKITLNKAYEFVAIFGPTLYWRNPTRRVQVRRDIELSPDMFGQMNDPMAQQIFQQAMQQQQARMSENRTRAQLMETYLNYTPNEQSGGGLALHSSTSITEGMVKGRGCLWVDKYSLPGSNKTLTGSFWDSVDNLLIDPDAVSIWDAKWIAKRCCIPVWEAERKFNLPKGTFKGRYESAQGQAARSNDTIMGGWKRQKGETFDLVEYFEIWSKGGVGTRLSGVDSPLKQVFDDVVGDFAYLVICPGVPFPLNAPSERVSEALPEEVEKMFRWPVPYWKQDRWPVAMLDFQLKPNSAWPIAPLSPAMGELIFINILTSHLANRIWTSSRDFIAVLRSACKNVKEIIDRGEDQSVIELDDIHGTIDQVLQFVKQPPTSLDAFNILDRITQNFERNTGLTEMVYGLQSVQSRSAADANLRHQSANVRVDDMAAKVEAWQTEAAKLEKFAARWYVTGQDVQTLIGSTGAYMWDRYITQEDPELVIFGMDATVEAGSSRKPNKQRDVENMNMSMQHLMPLFVPYAQTTGNTQPINALVSQWAAANDINSAGMQMGPMQPPPPPAPPPEVMQQQQAQQQFQQAMQQADLQSKQLDVTKRQLDVQESQIELQREQFGLQADMAKAGQPAQIDPAAQQAQQKLQFDALSHMSKLQQSEESHKQKMQQEQDQFTMNIVRTAANMGGAE